MARAVSNLVAALVLIAVGVAAAVFLAFVMGAFASRQQPITGDLEIASAEAYVDRDTLIVKAVVFASGSGPVNVTEVELYKGGAVVQCSSADVSGLGVLGAGGRSEIVVVCYGVSDVSLGDKIVVVARWVDVKSGESGVSKASATVS